MFYLPTGSRARQSLRKPLSALLMTCVLMVSGCASDLQRSAPQQQVVIDPTLMLPPNYTQRMLNFLSENPSDATDKSPIYKE